jgi:predicted PurR-regulated permease PerM
LASSGAVAFGFIGVFLGPTLLGVGYALLVDWSAGEQGRRRAAAGSPMPQGEAGPRN